MRALACFVAITAALPTTAQTAPQPRVSAERAALGLRLAESGDLDVILTATGEAEVHRVIGDMQGLSDTERAHLLAVGMATVAADRAGLLETLGDAYARRFSTTRLRAILSFLESPSGRAYVGALPEILPAIEPALRGVDLGRDVRAAICTDSGRLCAVAAPTGH